VSNLTAIKAVNILADDLAATVIRRALDNDTINRDDYEDVSEQDWARIKTLAYATAVALEPDYDTEFSPAYDLLKERNA